MKSCFFALMMIASTTQVFADSITDIPDNTKSVLSTSAAQPAVATVAQPVVTTATQPAVVTIAQPCASTVAQPCVASPTLSYRGKNKIAPCAVEKGACLSYCDKTTDACCNTTSQRVSVEVPICAPACPTKESVTRSRNGKKVVYDYGRYEAVLRADKEGNVDVKYRKRLLDR